MSSRLNTKLIKDASPHCFGKVATPKNIIKVLYTKNVPRHSAIKYMLGRAATIASARALVGIGNVFNSLTGGARV